jgi:hypothetical protein
VNADAAAQATSFNPIFAASPVVISNGIKLAGIEAIVNPNITDEYLDLWKNSEYKTGAITDPNVCTILIIDKLVTEKCRASKR